jgi:hypothetical protein
LTAGRQRQGRMCDQLFYDACLTARDMAIAPQPTE